MDKIFLNLVLFTISASFFWFFIKSLKNTLVSIEEIKKQNNKIKKWGKISAKVISISYGRNYIFKDYLPDTSHLKSEDEIKEFLDNFKEQEEEKINLVNLIGQVSIRYSYSFNEEEYESLSIGPIPSDKDIEIMYKLKEGGRFKIFVNPEDPRETYIRTEKKEELQSLFNSILIKNTKYFIMSFVFFILMLLSYFFNF